MDSTATMFAGVAGVQRSPEVTVQEKPAKTELKLTQVEPVEKKQVSVTDKAAEFIKDGRKDDSSQELKDATVIDAIENANRALKMNNSYMKFSIHEKTHQIMVRIVDSETDEVLREIPSEKVLDMVAKMWELAGVLVDEKR